MTKLYVQMYSFLENMHYDTKSSLEFAAQMGYNGVELVGMDLKYPLPQLNDKLKELQLEPISMHVPATQMVEQLIPVATTLNMKFLGIGMEYLGNDEMVHNFAQTLDYYGEICSRSQIMLTYHNHLQEFMPCEDSTIFDVLMRETNPKYVSFELDAGWCAAAGFDPIAVISKYGDRIKLIHIKESSEILGPKPAIDFTSIPKGEHGEPLYSDEIKAQMKHQQEINCEAGKGLVDWKNLKDVADKNGCQAFIVEREWSPKGTRIECLTDDLKYYKELFS